MIFGKLTQLEMNKFVDRQSNVVESSIMKSKGLNLYLSYQEPYCLSATGAAIEFSIWDSLLVASVL